MSFYNFKGVAGAAIALVAGLALAAPSLARPSAQSGDLLSQVNQPTREGTPQLLTSKVEGRITKVDGDQVEVRLTTGETKTYTISEAEQTRNELKVGSEVSLTVQEDDTVIAIEPAGSSTTETSGAMGTSGSSSSTSSTSSSSSTVIRRQTTVQQTSPTPAPAPAAQPAPQPVRGLW